jgi:dihydropyrimidinase
MTEANGARREHDLLIRGGTVVSHEGERELDVAIDGEKIAGLYDPGTEVRAAETIDAAGHLVIPGGVDPHVHYAMDFQGLLETEGPENSPAAVHGGDTTVVDFAIMEPPRSLHDTIALKKERLQGNMAVDYGLHAILTGEFSFENVEEIGDVIRSGMPTIKTMMTYGWMCDDGRRYGVMSETAEHGGMSVVHAEDDAIANWLTAKYVREGKTHGAHICEVRGPLVEEAATRRALFLAERAGSPLYILHMAAGSAIEALAEFRARGLPMYGETLAAYLSFTQDDLWDETPIEVNGKEYARGALYNNYPTPKFGSDRDTCWAAIADDRLQAVGTDHCLVKLKDRYEVMGTTVDAMQAGQAAVELRVPLVYSHGVATGRFSASRWVELVSYNPARLMGLWPAKGELAPGADADVVVFDPNRQWTVHWQDLHMSEPYSCWDGWELTGKVRDTVRRGQLLVREGNYVGSRSDGRFVERRLVPELMAGQLDPNLTRASQRGPAHA